ncbi:MAG: Do family serine endopeptidase [Methylibium sp.]|nr:Do family serine endopeptidase [Methylibium sp.]
MRMKSLSAALVAAGVLAVGTAGAIQNDWLPGEARAVKTNAVMVATVPAQPVPQLSADAVPNYRAIVQQAGPAVVGIAVQGTRKSNSDEGPERGLPPGFKLPPGFENSPFAPFFRGMPPGGQDGPPSPTRGQGSGFIISEDGLILTNAHVVHEADEVTVKLSDRREFTAKVLGADVMTDVAVLKIEAKDLPMVRLGDPASLQVGDPVLAIGAPFGFEQTATQGIVSGKGRTLPGEYSSVVPFIQTDAAVNPGNSGGPLFDGSGAVVGINAQIYSRTGGYQGLSFSIPINVALKVKDQIVATGKASHARLGVVIQDVNQGLAESFGLKTPDGALVASVAPDSPAAAAGLKSGDVITAVNGEPVIRSGSLSSTIGMSTPGETVELKVWRDRAFTTVPAKLAAFEDDKAVASADEMPAEGGQLGLALRPLTAQEQQAAKVTSGGMLIEKVGGPAARAGIQRGDVLLSVNGKPVESVAQVKSVLEKEPKSVALLVQRGENKIFVPVNLG